MRRLSVVVMGTLAAGAAGCAVTPSECNPANVDAGLYVKANCLYSGEYQRRADQKRAELDEELRLKDLFAQTYAALKAEQARVDQQSTDDRATLGDATQSVNALQKALKERARHDVHLKQQISDLQVVVEKIQQQPGQSPVQQRQSLTELMVKVSDLQNSLDLR